MPASKPRRTKQTKIALVAGEASGDLLGAALIRELSQRHPDAEFTGIGGNHMRAAGMETWWDCQELAVFGLFEVLSHFPRLYKIRRELRQRLLTDKPDIFIGIDAPDFNLGLENRLRRSGIRTVHYVSPTVWAWREKRVRKIARAVDLVLCLFPFEPDFYRGHGVSAVYVGHPMADQITEIPDPEPARRLLGIEPSGPVIALLPGSRAGEVSKLAGPMIEAAEIIAGQLPGVRFVSAMANARVRTLFESALEQAGTPAVQLVDNDSRNVIAAADVVMVASGTAALETMLVNRPMVVSYRLARSTWHLVKTLKLIKADHVSLPNILAGERLVPELLQQEATGPKLAQAVLSWLKDPGRRSALQQRFAQMNADLRCNAGEKAASAVSELLSRPNDCPANDHCRSG
jgi:lipid-A-disaccharide synthase